VAELADPVAEALDGLGCWLDDLDRQLPRLLESADLPVVVRVLQRMDVQTKRLRALAGLPERHVAHVLGTGRKEVAGIPLLVHGGWDRKEWDHFEVARRLAVDPVSGELLGEDPKVRAALRVVLAAGRHEWRVTDLRDRGIDPDDEDDPLCRRERKRVTVQFLTPPEVSR